MSAELSLNLPDYEFIETPTAWDQCVANLQPQSQLSIDLESNSMYAYQERVCLIQISVPGHDYIIDPQAGLDLSPLGVMVEDPSVEKIFHAAEYDLMLMKRDYGWQLQNLFDTMWAVRILGHSKVGLANVLEHYFNVELDKKYQKSNWCRRPLSAGELAYAQRDTHFLSALRDVLVAEIKSKGYWEEAQEIFAEQSVVKLPDTSFSADDFWRLNGVTKLKPAEQAIVKALFIYRDQEARRQNRPHFKIFGNKTILLLAEEKPRYMEDLRQIRGMSFGQIRRYGRHILHIIQENEGSPAPKRPPRRPRTPDDVVERYEMLHQWRKLRGQARGVESDVILSRDALWALAHENPQTIDQLAELNVLGPWRFKTYAADLIAQLQEKEG